MEALRKFQLAVVRYTLLVALVCTAVTWLWNTDFAKGVLMGGLAGAAGFWVTGFNMRQLTTPGAEKLPYYAVKWTFFRMTIYALAIYQAYTLDRERYYGLIAAVMGILLVQVVMVTVAVVTLGRSGKNRE